MQDCRPMSTLMITNWKKIDALEDVDVDPTLYRKLIRLLMYLVNRRPNIYFAVNSLSEFMVELKRVLWITTRHVLRLGGQFSGSENYFRVLLQYWIRVVSWGSRKQKSMALSFADAEYMASSMATCEAIWLRKLLVGLFGQWMDPTSIFCDNQSCLRLSKNPMFRDRSKHIDIRQLFCVSSLGYCAASCVSSPDYSDSSR
eukprot:PITA_22086